MCKYSVEGIGKEMSYVLLIIDPQIDFHEGGNLGVSGIPGLGGEGATKDSEKIIDLIRTKKPAAVYVSLDTHTPTHIGHAGFWQTLGGGPSPGVGVTFSVNASGNVQAESNGVVVGEYEPTPTGDAEKDEELKKWVIDYVSTLCEGGKFVPRIWPNHCFEGSEGHKVYPPLKAALDTLVAEGVPVEYHIKGQNEITEMYSIFKAELPAEGNAPASIATLYRGKHRVTNGKSKIETPKSDVDDHANLKTDFNQGLYDSLASHGKPVAVCGEALSHCVKWSTLDLMNNNPANLPIILLENASSGVNLAALGAPVDLFKGPTEKFRTDSTAGGVSWQTVEAFKGMAGGSRRRRSTRRRQNKKNRKSRRR